MRCEEIFEINKEKLLSILEQLEENKCMFHTNTQITYMICLVQGYVKILEKVED